MGLMRVAVDPEHRWNRVRVSGREFTKGGEVMAEGHLDEEMRTSPLLVIEPVEATDGVDATAAAVELAEEEGVDLRQVVGTGVGGRILVADVAESLEDS